jgi:hypothetical protein
MESQISRRSTCVSLQLKRPFGCPHSHSGLITQIPEAMRPATHMGTGAAPLEESNTHPFSVVFVNFPFSPRGYIALRSRWEARIFCQRQLVPISASAPTNDPRRIADFAAQKSAVRGGTFPKQELRIHVLCVVMENFSESTTLKAPVVSQLIGLSSVIDQVIICDFSRRPLIFPSSLVAQRLRT